MITFKRDPDYTLVSNCWKALTIQLIWTIVTIQLIWTIILYTVGNVIGKNVSDTPWPEMNVVQCV